MPAGGYFSYRDNSGEISTMSFNTRTITAANLAAIQAQFATLQTAMGGMLIGRLVEVGLYVNRTRLANENAASQYAQRETKWLVTYEDATEFLDAPANTVLNMGFRKVFTAEIPTADLGGVEMFDDGEKVDLTGIKAVAFIAAFEALVVTPYGGAANVLRIEHIGRNT